MDFLTANNAKLAICGNVKKNCHFQGPGGGVLPSPISKIFLHTSY
jgi:hypothetical protein